MSNDDRDYDGERLERETKDMSVRARILYSAVKLTTGEKNKSYGDPTANHDNIALLWNAYISIRCGVLEEQISLDAEDCELMMVLLKVARAAQRLNESDSEDTFFDMAAYSAMAGEARANRVKE